jgi:tetratricopeptide (TPR) repeat protein
VSIEPARKPYLLALYHEYLEKQDSASFASRVSNWYGSGTLERLVRHDTREVRRAAAFALGLLGDYNSNHALGCALHDKDRTVRTLAESGIRAIWNRAGTETDRRELAVIVRLNEGRIYQEAIDRATTLVDRAPWIAEAWYQRSAAQFGLGHLIESIRDCHQAMEINPYHFVAATSMGHAYLELQNTVSALECFRRALRLNPDLEGVRVQVAQLSRTAEGNR